MDGFSLLVGAAASVIAVLLGLLTLGGRARRWVLSLVESALSSPSVEAMLEKVTKRVLVETGVIRYSRAEPHTEWPNGWDNLPDALGALYVRIARIEEQTGE